MTERIGDRDCRQAWFWFTVGQHMARQYPDWRPPYAWLGFRYQCTWRWYAPEGSSHDTVYAGMAFTDENSRSREAVEAYVDDVIAGVLREQEAGKVDITRWVP